MMRFWDGASRQLTESKKDICNEYHADVFSFCLSSTAAVQFPACRQGTRQQTDRR